MKIALLILLTIEAKAAREIYFPTGIHPNHLKFTEARNNRLDGVQAYELPDGDPAYIQGYLEFSVTNLSKKPQTVRAQVYRYDGAELTGWDISLPNTCSTLASDPKCTCRLTTTYQTCRPWLYYANNNEIPYYGRITVYENTGGVLATARFVHRGFWSCCSFSKTVDNYLNLRFPILINGGLPF